MNDEDETTETFPDQAEEDSSSQKINFLDFSESVFIKKKVINPSNSPTILKPSKTNLNFDEFFIAKMLKKTFKIYKEIIPLKSDLKYLFMAIQRNSTNVFLLFFEENKHESMNFKKMQTILENLHIHFFQNESMCICSLCKETIEFNVKFKDQNYFLSQIKIGDFNLTSEISRKRELQKRFEKNEIYKILFDLTSQIFSLNLNGKFFEFLNTDMIISSKLGEIFFALDALADETNREDLEGLDVLNNCLISCISLNNESNQTEANNTIQEFKRECELVKSGLDLSLFTPTKSYPEMLEKSTEMHIKASKNILQSNMHFLGNLINLLNEQSEDYSKLNIGDLNSENYFFLTINYLLDLENVNIYKTRNFLEFFFSNEEKIKFDIVKLSHTLSIPFFNINQILSNTTFKTDYIDKTTGKAKLIYDCGYVYEGDYAFNSNNAIIKNGSGVLLSGSRFKYEGEFKNDSFHGNGQLVLFNKKYLFEGSFNKGKMCGKGRIEINNEKYFYGEFFNNQFCLEKFINEKIDNSLSEVIFGYFAFENKFYVKEEGLAKEYYSMLFLESYNELLEINLTNLVLDSKVVTAVCSFISKQLNFEKFFAILKYSKKEKLWILFCHKINTLALRMKIFVSRKELETDKLVLILNSFVNLCEDIAINTYAKKNNDRIESLIKELCLHLPANYKIKKINLKNNVLVSSQIFDTLVNHTIFQKVKKINFRNSLIKDEYIFLLCRSNIITNLEDLVLRNCNNLTDKSIEHLCNCFYFSSLKDLDLSKLQITDAAIKYLNDAKFSKNLSKLDLSENYSLTDSGFICFFTKSCFFNLTKLYLNYNNLTETALSCFFESKRFVSLKKVKLKKCWIEDNDLKLIEKSLKGWVFKSIKKMDFSFSNMPKHIFLQILRKNPNIQNLKIDFCTDVNTFTPSENSIFKDLTFLENFDFSGGLIPPCLLEILPNANLRKLNFSCISSLTNNQLLGILNNCHKLIELNISFTKATDELFKDYVKFERVSDLRNLIAVGTCLGDDCLSVLFGREVFQHLRILDLSQTKVRDEGIIFMSQNFYNTKIYKLLLARCYHLTNAGVNKIIDNSVNSYLKILDLSFNNIDKNIFKRKNYEFVNFSIKANFEGCKGISDKDILEWKRHYLDYRDGYRKKEYKRLKEFYFNESAILTEELDFSWSKITDNDAINLCHSLFLKNVKILNISNTAITDNGIKAICNCDQFISLEILNLSNCVLISENIIHYLTYSKYIKKLKKIDISKIVISNTELFQISVSNNFENLEEIDLSYCKHIEDIGIIYLLTSLTLKIKKIILDFTNITKDLLTNVLQLCKKDELKYLEELKIYFSEAAKHTELISLINENYNLIIYS